MRKLLESNAVPCLVDRNFPVLAVIVLASLVAGCADGPRQAGHAAAVQSTKLATTAPAAPAVANDDDQLECKNYVPIGTMVPKKICYTARQKAEWLAEAPYREAVTEFYNYNKP